jgi:hypothetical protein
MFGATVPKATINENCQLLFFEYEVRLSEKILSPTPSRNSIFAKNRNYPQFSVFIFVRANPGHYLRPFSFVENIRHDTNGYAAQRIGN